MHTTTTFTVALALTALTAAIPYAGHKHQHMHLHARTPQLHARTPQGQSNTGQCGGDLGFTCAAGYCCSSWGYCGKSAAYCDAGCQSKYGTCGGADSTSGNSTSSAEGTGTTLAAVTAAYSRPLWSAWSSSSAVETSAPSSSAAAVTTTLLTSTLPSAATTYSPTSTYSPTPSSYSAPAVISSSAPAPSSYSAPAPSSTSSSGSSGGLGDTYTVYSGDGGTAAGWPAESDWIDWESMWTNNMAYISISCAQFGEADNSAIESANMKSAIESVAATAQIDERFVLAVVMQESKGCVRAPTTNYGVTNPGLMQSHDGTGSCNNGAVQDPCPQEEITQMIKEGTTGTAAGDGLQQTMDQCGATDVSKYYKAARIYNSGSIAASGNLDDGIATHCYSSDIANRLTGWVKAETKCTLG